jgi:hypothetical protein
MERTEGRSSDIDTEALENHRRGRCMMAVMNHTGDHRLTWDPMNEKEVDEAREEFNRLKKMGYIAYRLNIIDPEVRGPKVSQFHRWDGEIILEFDKLPKDQPSEVVMSPQMVGG